MKENAFVFVVCGDRHTARANMALKFLRHFSRSDIIVIKGRTRLKVDCDRVIEPKIPAGLDNRRAAIFLKTSLHQILDSSRGRFCYLDNDVMAVHESVDEIFNQYCAPISFAADHCRLRQFSRHAVKCGCAAPECDHLHAALRDQFGIAIPDKNWRHWNGGVFIFDRN